MFGDSLVGTATKDGDRKDFTFIHNSVGVQKKITTYEFIFLLHFLFLLTNVSQKPKNRDNVKVGENYDHINFFFGNNGGKPVSFFNPQPQNTSVYFWLMQGFHLPEKQKQTKAFYFFTPRVLNNGGMDNDGVSIIKCGSISESNIQNPNSWICLQSIVPFQIANDEEKMDFGITGNAIVFESEKRL